jgi:hypothetical protein
MQSRTVYCKLASGQFSVHHSISVRKRPVNPVHGFSINPSDTVTAIPPDAAPVDILSEPKFLSTTPKACWTWPSSTPILPPVSWHDYVSRLPSWSRDLLQDVIFVLPIVQCLQLLQTDPSLFLASDGGALPFWGSFGCLLATPNTVFVTASGRAFGEDPCSFRSKPTVCSLRSCASTTSINTSIYLSPSLTSTTTLIVRVSSKGLQQVTI